MPVKIGTLKESSLHAALKAHFAEPGDRSEVEVLGYFVDIFRADPAGERDEVIEIQTGNFAAMRAKLRSLLDTHRVTVVYPLAEEKFILHVKDDAFGRESPLARRRSPKRGRIEEVLEELLYVYESALHPHFTLKVVFVREVQIRRDDGRGSWRRRGVSIVDRRLEAVLGERCFSGPSDYAQLLPSVLGEPFTVKELAAVSKLPSRTAGRMAYCLCKMDVIRMVGKKRNCI